MISESNIIPVFKDGPFFFFCDHRRGWLLRAEAHPGLSQSLCSSRFCWHLPRRTSEKLTWVETAAWNRMDTEHYCSQRVSFYINCRKPDTHIKMYYGRVRARRKMLLPGLTSIITWYMFCPLGGISWHRFSHQPKHYIFSGNTADVSKHREAMSNMEERPALCFFHSFMLAACLYSISSEQSVIHQQRS